MNVQLFKFVSLVIIAASLITGCNGHGIRVTVGHNNCATVTCPADNTKTNISIH